MHPPHSIEISVISAYDQDYLEQHQTHAHVVSLLRHFANSSWTLTAVICPPPRSRNTGGSAERNVFDGV